MPPICSLVPASPEGLLTPTRTPFLFPVALALGPADFYPKAYFPGSTLASQPLPLGTR